MEQMKRLINPQLEKMCNPKMSMNTIRVDRSLRDSFKPICLFSLLILASMLTSSRWFKIQMMMMRDVLHQITNYKPRKPLATRFSKQAPKVLHLPRPQTRRSMNLLSGILRRKLWKLRRKKCSWATIWTYHTKIYPQSLNFRTTYQTKK